MECVEIAIGPQIGVLHHVLGIGRVARQPAGKVECGIEMRQSEQLEASASIVLGQGLVPDCGLPCPNTRRADQLIPAIAGNNLPGDAGRASEPGRQADPGSAGVYQ